MENNTIEMVYSGYEFKSILDSISENRLPNNDCFVVLKSLESEIKKHKNNGYILSDFGFLTYPLAFYTKFVKQDLNKFLSQFVDISNKEQEISKTDLNNNLKVTIIKLEDGTYQIKSFDGLDLAVQNVLGVLNYSDAIAYLYKLKSLCDENPEIEISKFEKSLLERLISEHKFSCDLRYYNMLGLNTII